MCCTMLIFLCFYLVVCDMNVQVIYALYNIASSYGRALSYFCRPCIIHAFLYTITSSNGLVLWYVEHFHLLKVPNGLIYGLCMYRHHTRALSKFGDWDAVGREFSVAFNKLCNETNCTSRVQGFPFKKVTHRVDVEDLYKPIFTPRRESVRLLSSHFFCQPSQ
mgnify:FL=1